MNYSSRIANWGRCHSERERFRAKAYPGLDPGWTPVRVKKTRQNKRVEPGSDSIGTDKALGFVGGNRFHQGHQLALNGLVLDLAVGAQQPQAERAFEEQQAFDFPRLAVAVVEERHGHVERGGDLLQTGSADAVDTLFVLLDLLEADAEFVAELCLRDLLLYTPQANPLAQFNVGFAGTALLHLLCCCSSHSGFTALRSRSPGAIGQGFIRSYRVKSVSAREFAVRTTGLPDGSQTHACVGSIVIPAPPARFGRWRPGRN